MYRDLDINFCKILKQSEKYKNELKHEYVGTEHIILSLLKKTTFSKQVKKFNLTFDGFYNEVKTNIPPIKNRAIVKSSIIAILANKPPKANDPESPINIFAG